MTKTAKLLLLIAFCWPGGSLAGQGLDPALLTKPATDAWPTYAGDYSQRRYSTLAQIDTTNVRHLSLAWVSRLTAGAGGGGRGVFSPPPPPTGHRGCGGKSGEHSRIDQRLAASVGIDSAGERHPLHLVARQCVGDGRAGRAHSLALLVEVARGHAHRQSRHGDVRRLAVLRDAGRLSRFARREDRPGALAQRDRGLQPAILLDDGTTSGRRSCAGGDG